jgi:hypothetical protein
MPHAWRCTTTSVQERLLMEAVGESERNPAFGTGLCGPWTKRSLCGCGGAHNQRSTLSQRTTKLRHDRLGRIGSGGRHRVHGIDATGGHRRIGWNAGPHRDQRPQTARTDSPLPHVQTPGQPPSAGCGGRGASHGLPATS